MGPYLSAPNKKKDSVDGEHGILKYGGTGMQGWRNTMEDTHLTHAKLTDDTALFGVFDGHGGQEVALYC